MRPPSEPRWTAWHGEPSFDEVLFVEVALDDGRRLWLRHTLRADRDAAAAGRRVWAILTAPDGHPSIHIRRSPTGAPDGRGTWLSTDASLSASEAHGRAGPLHWSLSFTPDRPGHAHVPRWMTDLGLGRTYESHALRVTVRGTLDAGDGPRTVSGVAVLGHIHGRRNRTAAWAWAWAGGFADADAAFEGLSARIGSARAPALTSLVLDLDGERHAFSDTVALATTWSSFGPLGWRAHARRRGVALTVDVQPGPHPTTLRYDDPPQAPILCTNAAGAHLRLHLQVPGKPRRTLVATHATMEYARRAPEGHDGLAAAADIVSAP
ncbi:MAG: hypothetical protein RLZZ383_2611 [Pseudomonadota bacterium]|jgi:hypothetical protein